MSRATLHGSATLYKPINTAAADSELVAAVAGKIIRVHGLCLTTDAAQTDLTLQSDGAADTEIAAFQVSSASPGPIVLPVCEQGWCETVAGEALDLRHTGTGAVDGVLVYSIQDR